MAENGHIYVISRNNYDALESVENNSIYLVRENTSATDKLLSMYLGRSKQADVLDISSNVDYDSITEEYEIPQDYEVKGKLFLCRHPLDTSQPADYYRVFMWDGSKYVNCFGTPNNVIVSAELPSVSSGVNNYVYIITGNNKGLYVFNGTRYVAILNLSDYPTTEWVENYVATYVSEHGTEVNVDDITIRKQQSGKLYGAVAEIGERYVQYEDDLTSNIITAQAGQRATVYNYIPTSVDTTQQNNPLVCGTLMNVALGNYSNAFGYKARALADNSLAVGNSVYVHQKADHGKAVGYGLINKSINCTIVGTFNYLSSENTESNDTLPKDYVFILSNGESSSSRSDAISVDWNGYTKLYGKTTTISGNTVKIDGTGNVEAFTGATLATLRTTVSGPPQSQYVDQYLPENSREILISNESNNYARISSIQINDVSNMNNSSGSHEPRTSDYSCVYVFVKDPSVIVANNIMTNFTSNNTSDVTVSDAPPKIHLLNPDLDISEYNVIHVFVFYDGIRMCAIVAGYPDSEFAPSTNLLFGNNENPEENDSDVDTESNIDEDQNT